MSSYEKMTDEQLIEDYRAGEEKIIDILMDKYKPMVRKKARAMYLLGGENEDLIQEGMIGLFKAVRDFDFSHKTSFYSFAELCISRQIYSAVEAANRKKHMPLNSYVSLYEEKESEGDAQPLINTIQAGMENNPEALFLNQEYTDALQESLWESLSPLESKVLYLHLQGTDYRTIAELIDRSPKTVDNAIQRIKSKAEKLWKDKKVVDN